MSSFLFGNDKPIGELLTEDPQNELPFMAIVNVCNVPLQIIDQNKNITKELSLDYLRKNCKVIDELSNNLKERLLIYSKAHTIIVCGEFAQAYYNQIKGDFKLMKPLFVPHPSFHHWQFIYENKDDISTLKWLFKKI